MRAVPQWPKMPGLYIVGVINHWMWATLEGHNLEQGGLLQLRPFMTEMTTDSCLLTALTEAYTTDLL